MLFLPLSLLPLPPQKEQGRALREGEPFKSILAAICARGHSRSNFYSLKYPLGQRREAVRAFTVKPKALDLRTSLGASAP